MNFKDVHFYAFFILVLPLAILNWIQARKYKGKNEAITPWGVWSRLKAGEKILAAFTYLLFAAWVSAIFFFWSKP